MEFNDLNSQYIRLKPKIDKRIADVLNHGKFIMGPEVAEFESRLAKYTGSNYVITCGNGTDALQLALMAIGAGQGHAVFTTPFTFTATAEPVALLGATPVFADIDPLTLNLCPSSLRQAIVNVKNNGELLPKAVIAVDIFGMPADYEEIRQICDEFQLTLIADAAQSMGATYKGRKVGNLADISTTSFFPSKPLGCYGDGGAVFTNDEQIANIISSLKFHGKGTNKYENTRVGLNSRLDTIQAAILLEKLEVLDEEIIARNSAVEVYCQNLPEALLLQPPSNDGISARAQFTIKVPPKRRGITINYLKERDIPSQVYYPRPLNQSVAYADYTSHSLDTPVSTRLSSEVLSLPISADISHEEVKLVSGCLMTALGN